MKKKVRKMRKAMPAKKGTVRKKSVAKKEDAPVASGREEFLLKKITEPPAKAPERHLQLQDLLYNVAPELQTLAFRSGFKLGSDAFACSDGTIGSLEHILENAGLGKVSYYPFETRSMFASYRIKAKSVNLGINTHTFEAGVIAGFLSAHSKSTVTASEVACVFNGARACQFVAVGGESFNPQDSSSLDMVSIVRALDLGIRNAEARKGESAYYMLAIRPLLSEPMLGEASKFLYLSGKMLVASQKAHNFAFMVKKASDFLGIDGVKVTDGKNGSAVVRLAYNTTTSVSRFVDLSTALLSGMFKGAFGRNVKVKRDTDSKGIYIVRMQVSEE